MATTAIMERAREEGWSDEQLVEYVLAGDASMYELLIRRYNRRLYRIVRAILRDDSETEEVMQSAYMRAYQNLAAFAGRAKFSTWLTRIAVHEAFACYRRRKMFQPLDRTEESSSTSVVKLLAFTGRTPEEAAYDRELRDVLEKAILRLPEDHRLVFMLRDVEEMSTEDTAQCLKLSQENVKVRLHRARATLRNELCAKAGATTLQCFHFHASRCDRVVESVLTPLRREEKEVRLYYTFG